MNSTQANWNVKSTASQSRNPAMDALTKLQVRLAQVTIDTPNHQPAPPASGANQLHRPASYHPD